MKEDVSIVSDGVTFRFLPITVELDREINAAFDIIEDRVKFKQKISAIFDRVIIEPVPKDLKKKSVKPSEVYTFDEMLVCFRLWREANTLSPEEKKS